MSNETTDYITDNLEIAVENYIAALGNALDQQQKTDHIMSIMSWMDTSQLVEFIEHWTKKGK